MSFQLLANSVTLDDVIALTAA